MKTNYNYDFDNKKRLTTKTATNSAGHITIEKYSYNDNNKPDTVLIYNNDTTIWTPQQPFVGEQKLNETPSLKNINLYSYFDSNRVSIQKCNYPYIETYRCKTYETINSDTLDISTELFWGRQSSCIVDSVQTLDYTKTHKRNGLVYLKEESNAFFKGKIYYRYKVNNLGLVTQTKTISVENSRKSTFIFTHKYYFIQ